MLEQPSVPRIPRGSGLAIAAVLLLAACGGGKDEESGPDATAALGPLQKAEPSAPAEAGGQAGAPDAAGETSAKSEAGSADAGGAIPAAIRGRWALKAADCAAKRGADLTVLTIDAANLRFYESHGELARIRESAADHIMADYRFSGEGEEWDRRMQLTVEENGKTLVRRDYGEGAAPEPIRYSRCA